VSIDGLSINHQRSTINHSDFVLRISDLPQGASTVAGVNDRIEAAAPAVEARIIVTDLPPVAKSP
jgi:hypothetical protein